MVVPLASVRVSGSGRWRFSAVMDAGGSVPSGSRMVRVSIDAVSWPMARRMSAGVTASSWAR